MASSLKYVSCGQRLPSDGWQPSRADANELRHWPYAGLLGVSKQNKQVAGETVSTASIMGPGSDNVKPLFLLIQKLWLPVAPLVKAAP